MEFADASTTVDSKSQQITVEIVPKDESQIFKIANVKTVRK